MFTVSVNPELQAVQNRLVSNLESQYKMVLMAWLDGKGFKPDVGRPNVFVDSLDPTRQLTKVEFETLRDDPNTGLDQFIASHFNHPLEPAAGPRP